MIACWNIFVYEVDSWLLYVIQMVGTMIGVGLLFFHHLKRTEGNAYYVRETSLMPREVAKKQVQYWTLVYLGTTSFGKLSRFMSSGKELFNIYLKSNSFSVMFQFC